ncbi:MAG: BatA domain-containing protein [Acidobacteria bacterium]|nr:BatA domain-containing protein [Acidobacteriota bacterium]
MGFFSPWFFAGILAVGLPLWIHLLRQHKSVPRPFASLMFFERRTQSSIKHRRLKHYALLMLRLAMILLLVLLFADPFIRRSVPIGTGRKLVFVAVDNSFSMRYGDHLDRARAEALSVLAKLGGGDVAQVAAISDHVELLTQPVGDRPSLEAAVRAIKASDAASAYAEFARYLRTLPKSVNLPVEAHFISDVQKSAMPPSFGDLALADRVTLQIHPIITAGASNWVAEAVTAPARIFGTHKARIQATVAWNGPAEPKPVPRAAKVTLLMNGKPVATKSVDVTGRAAVEFQDVDMPHGPNRGEIRVEPADSFKEDNSYLFAIERADAARILYIYDSRQSPAYFRAAIESGSESAFEVDALTPEQAGAQNLSKYAYVALAGGSVSGALEASLKNYVAGGGGLLIVLSPLSASSGRVPVLDSRVTDRSYSPREGARFQTASSVDNSHPALDRASGFDGVKFYWAARVEAGQDRVLARLGDGTPLLLERRIGEGRVLALTSSFDNVSNDLPLHALFVPFVERVSEYLEGGEAMRTNIVTGAAIELRASKDRGAAADVVGPDGARMLSLKEASTALSVTARDSGFYDVRTAGGRRELVAVNPDRRESDLTPVPEETLALWRGAGGATPVAAQGSAPEQTPESLALWVLVALLIVSLVESWLADRFTPAARDEKPEIRKQAA